MEKSEFECIKCELKESGLINPNIVFKNKKFHYTVCINSCIYAQMPPHVLNKIVPTYISYNEHYINLLDRDAAIFVILHEVGHINQIYNKNGNKISNIDIENNADTFAAKSYCERYNALNGITTCIEAHEICESKHIICRSKIEKKIKRLFRVKASHPNNAYRINSVKKILNQIKNNKT